MSTIKRIITVETLDDVADAIAERVTEQRKQCESYVRARERNPAHMTQKTILEARAIGYGLSRAEAIVRDCQFKPLIGKGE